MLAKASIQEKQFRFLGTLTPRQNKESLPWTLGPSLEGDDRGGTTIRDKLSRTLTHPRWSSLRKRASSGHEYHFPAPLTRPQRNPVNNKGYPYLLSRYQIPSDRFVKLSSPHLSHLTVSFSVFFTCTLPHSYGILARQNRLFSLKTNRSRHSL